MDYLCAKFGNFSFSGSAVLVLSCGQTDRITEVDDRYTHRTKYELKELRMNVYDNFCR